MENINQVQTSAFHEAKIQLKNALLGNYESKHGEQGGGPNRIRITPVEG